MATAENQKDIEDEDKDKDNGRAREEEEKEEEEEIDRDNGRSRVGTITLESPIIQSSLRVGSFKRRGRIPYTILRLRNASFSSETTGNAIPSCATSVVPFDSPSRSAKGPTDDATATEAERHSSGPSRLGKGRIGSVKRK